MYLRRAVFALICLMMPLSLPAGEPGKVRELDTKTLKIDFAKGRITAPKVITTAEELDKAIPDAEAIKKQVDFGKEKLVLFAWGGSGGDRLSVKLDTEGKVSAVLTYRLGLTRDFRRHVHLYAIPKGAEVKIEQVK